MIKTPVSYDDSENIFYPYPQVEDADGSFIFECKNKDVASEIVKRINMHDELVKSLDEMCGVWRLVCNSNGWDENHMSQYENAIKLLERCK